MPHLGDIPEEAEAREFGVDNAVDDATCCVPGRGARNFAGIAAISTLLSDTGVFSRNFLKKIILFEVNLVKSKKLFQFQGLD